MKSGFWPARRFADLAELDGQYADWRDRVCNSRRHGTGRFAVCDRLAEERQALPSDILWTLNHPDVYQLLVRVRGWTPRRYERWLADITCSQLLR